MPPAPAPWTPRQTASQTEVLRGAAKRATNQEQNDAEVQDDLAADDVRETAVQRHETCTHEEVRLLTSVSTQRPRTTDDAPSRPSYSLFRLQYLSLWSEVLWRR